MTSRRKFLGLLAAAPVVGPEMAKAAVESSYASTLASSSSFTKEMYGLPKPYLRGVTSDLGPLNLGWQGIALNPRDGVGPFEIINVPNRLYGSYVNEDGDAV